MASEPVDGARPFAVLPGEGDVVEGPVGGPLTFKARGSDTGGRMTAVENVIPPGQGPPLHVHASEDEAWWVIEGSLRFQLGSDVAEAPAGSFVFVPRGTPHAFVNDGASPARILMVFTPSGMERFFDEIGSLPSGGEAGSPPPAEVFASIGAAVGMEVVGPPLR